MRSSTFGDLSLADWLCPLRVSKPAALPGALLGAPQPWV